MPHYRVTLAYDGSDFQGWQMQARDRRTVQASLEGALEKMDGAGRVPAVGAGRTDAGVHADAQVACFELARELAPEQLLRALNGLLPADVRVLAAAYASPTFHARKDAISKVYRYVMDMGPIQLPKRRRYAGHVPWRLNEAAVRQAAELVLGRHDFASLMSSGSSVKTTVRTVMRSEVRFDPSTLVYEVEADGFLRKMVRSLVGGLVAAGRGTHSVDELARGLEARDRRAWPAPVEARGLSLVRVEYAVAQGSG
jgi:tRNA pseudouridine38-40 synthase